MSSRIRKFGARPARMGLGDMVEKLAHPVAVALRLPCLDRETLRLMPDSPCGRRRDRLNEVGRKIGIG